MTSSQRAAASRASASVSSTSAPSAGVPRQARVSAMHEFLAGLDDAQMEELFTRRPDLVRVAQRQPEKLATFACRARSVGEALLGVATPTFQVARAVLEVGLSQAALAGAVGITPASARESLEELRSLGIILGDRIPRGLRELFGPHSLVLRAPQRPDPASVSLLDLPQGQLGFEAARAGEQAVLLTDRLLDDWEQTPAHTLRGGGVGVRVLRATASRLGLEPIDTARIVNTAEAAGLLGRDDEGYAWMPSDFSVTWRDAELPQRWAALVFAWVGNRRIPWEPDLRGDNGQALPLLGEETNRHLVPARRAVLQVLAGLPTGASPDAAWLTQELAYLHPMMEVPQVAVEQILTDAAFFGLTESGALTPAGAVAGRIADQLVEGQSAGLPALLEELAATVQPFLASSVPVLLVQSDLTAVVPGRPSPELESFLKLTSVEESREAALTVRFSLNSLRPAFDAGMSGDEIRAELEGFSATPLPSALTMLISDAARHFGAIRIRPLGAVLRIEDPALVAELLRAKKLQDLGLAELAPGIVAAQADAHEVLTALRDLGHAPVLEDGSGVVLTVNQWSKVRGMAQGPGAQWKARSAGLPSKLPSPSHVGADHYAIRLDYQPTAMDETFMDEHPEAVSTVLTALSRRRTGGENLRGIAHQVRAVSRALLSGHDSDPYAVIEDLNYAQANGHIVQLALAGDAGDLISRRVKITRVEGGRVRAIDVDRETELTVALHRIASVDVQK